MKYKILLAIITALIVILFTYTMFSHQKVETKVSYNGVWTMTDERGYIITLNLLGQKDSGKFIKDAPDGQHYGIFFVSDSSVCLIHQLCNQNEVLYKIDKTRLSDSLGRKYTRSIEE